MFYSCCIKRAAITLQLRCHYVMKFIAYLLYNTESLWIYLHSIWVLLRAIHLFLNYYCTSSNLIMFYPALLHYCIALLHCTLLYSLLYMLFLPLVLNPVVLFHTYYSKCSLPFKSYLHDFPPRAIAKPAIHPYLSLSQFLPFPHHPLISHNSLPSIHPSLLYVRVCVCVCVCSGLVRCGY